jgi:hypothetical protein
VHFRGFAVSDYAAVAPLDVFRADTFPFNNSGAGAVSTSSVRALLDLVNCFLNRGA